MEQRVIFGGYRFDRSTGRLWSGKREVRLTPKATAVLGALVTRAGELVTKEDLLGSVWRDTAVSDDALTSCVQELRKALADNAKQPRFIETRHRRGYRFIARVSEATSKEPKADSRSLSRTPKDRWTDLNPDAAGPAKTGAGLSEIRGRPTVAVLPFNNVSGHTDQEYFTEGITEDIITALSKHRSLLVIARTSTFAFKGRSIDARRAGMDLGADYVVEGSVDKSGQRLRIRARLIEGDVGRQVWAERYDRKLEDVFDVQDEITTAIAARIEPEVGSVERLRAERKSPEAFRAWDFFHLGMKHFYKSTVEDNVEAQRLLRCAIELDPTLAQAHAWLSYAIVLSMIYFDADPDDQRLDVAVMLAKKGVELDDQDAVTHFGYGRALLARKAYEDALAELESAAELNPTLAIAYCGLGDSLAYEGRIEEAIPYFEKAISLSPYDPHRWAFYSYRALAHLFGGQFGHAFDWAQKAIRVPNCHYWPFAHRVSALGHLQQVDATRAAKAELLQRKPEFSCAFARRRLFFIKNPAHLELYIEGLLKAGIGA
jgi:TolB-like protein/DNA-binding winged helix-turn-helix (wHTH) protein